MWQVVTTFRPHTMQVAVLQELRRRIHDRELRPGPVIRVDAVAGGTGGQPDPGPRGAHDPRGGRPGDAPPHVGFTVPSPTAEELEEIYFIRALLEDEALRRALENTTDADRAAAREACRAAEEALHHGQVNAFSDNGRRFHEALLVPCHMPRLLRLLAGAQLGTCPPTDTPTGRP